MPFKYKNWLNIKVGRLTPIQLLERKDSQGCRIWLCKCDCGNTKEISSKYLYRRDLFGCGCLKGKSVVYMDRTIPAKNSVYQRYKRRAKDKSILFDITFDKFIEIASKPCYYCGEFSVNQRTKLRSSIWFYSGIDRIDNNLGYVDGNMISCCGVCNLMKRHHSINFFLSHINRISKHHSQCRSSLKETAWVSNGKPNYLKTSNSSDYLELNKRKNKILESRIDDKK